MRAVLQEPSKAKPTPAQEGGSPSHQGSQPDKPLRLVTTSSVSPRCRHVSQNHGTRLR
ncbi:hypothetical protein FRACA_810013 [Frankia canadensis]|uniref:Uncharacterized protein n=1 Tax=Frankia canadensis TaxID=1836972 RepID=A0A2I2L1M3_9ACTN|nr:hypothetical protein FRACA_810013 [Frankia canadensis]SOU59112.1 hypothetical protein FRACA_810013 [Frankia canadensis]